MPDVKIRNGVTTAKLNATEANQLRASADTLDALSMAFKGSGGYAAEAAKLRSYAETFGPKAKPAAAAK